jgi:hypothetical protein
MSETSQRRKRSTKAQTMTTEPTPLPAPSDPSRRVAGSRRPQSHPRTGRRRPHKAAGARVAAAGLGMTTMFGLVAAMGYAEASTGTTSAQAPTPIPASTAPPQVVVVMRRTPVTPTETVPAESVPAASAPVTAPPSAPVQLTARPDVRVITPAPTRSPSRPASPTAAAPAAAPAPAASTSGSR